MKFIIAAAIGAVTSYTHAKLVEVNSIEEAKSLAVRFAVNEFDGQHKHRGLSSDAFIVQDGADVKELGKANEIASGRLKLSAVEMLRLDYGNEVQS